MKRSKMKSLEGAAAEALVERLNIHPSAIFEDDDFALSGKVRLWKRKDGSWTARAVFRNRANNASISSIVATVRGVTLN